MENYIVYIVLVLSGIVMGLLYAIGRHNDAYRNNRYLGNPYNPYRRHGNSGLFMTIFAATVIGAIFFAHYDKERQNQIPESEGRGVRTGYSPSEREQQLNEIALVIEGKRERQAPTEPKEPVYASMNMFPMGSNTSRPQVQPAPEPETVPQHQPSVYIQRMALSNYMLAKEKAEELSSDTGILHHLGVNWELESGAYKLLIGPFENKRQAQDYLQRIGGNGFVFDNAQYGLEVELVKKLIY